MKSLSVSRFRKALLLVAVVLVVFGAGAYAYWTLWPPRSGPRVATISSPLEFSMELDKTEYQLGENVTLRLTLKNIGNETIMVRWPDYGVWGDEDLYFDFYVFDENGTKIFQRGDYYSVLNAVLKRTLNPGEQLSNTYYWFQMTGYPDLAQVPRGTYSVRGWSRNFAIQTSGISLETPSITFNIR